MSNASKVLLKTAVVTIANFGNPETLGLPAGTKSMDLYIQARSGNSGTIKIGDTTGQAWTVGTTPFKLTNFFLNGIERYITMDDVRVLGTNNGDVLEIMYTVVS